MRIAIDAARTVEGSTAPNPWVGAVLVRDGAVLSVGATAPYGGPHAEAAALHGVDARGATLYVTLEPCVPFDGKRTPPCSAAIVAAGVARVVVGIPDPHFPGAGIERLRAAGIHVDAGDGAPQITSLLRPYLHLRQVGRPYVIVKFAVSLDGMAGAPGSGIRWLTGPAAIERVHQDRARAGAILVGSGTVLTDDPALTARPGGILAARQPLRVVLDSRGRSPLAARVFDGQAPTAVATTAASPSGWKAALRARDVDVLEIEPATTGLSLPGLLDQLAARGIISVIAEGGPTLHSALLAQGLAGEVHAYVAPRLLGQGIPLIPARSLPLPLELRQPTVEPLTPDVLIRGYIGTWSP